MKGIQTMTQEEIQVLINEFLVSRKIHSKEDIATELIRFLRKKEMKIENGNLFNQLHDIIEKKYFS